MIFDGLLAVDLPATPGPPLETSSLDGLNRWLFTGRWHQRTSTCALSSGAVLARVLATLREQGPWTFTLRDDAGVLLDLPLASPDWGVAPASWPERLPRAWTTQPCDFQLLANRVDGHTAEAITVRFQPRHEVETGALVAAVRLAWSVPLPEEAAHRQRDLLVTLESDDALDALAQTLRRRGEARLHALADGLAARCGGPAHVLAPQVHTLWGLAEAPNAFADLLAGLGDDATQLAAELERRLSFSTRSWPALDARGVPGRLQRGVFHPNTLREVSDAL